MKACSASAAEKGAAEVDVQAPPKGASPTMSLACATGKTGCFICLHYPHVSSSPLVWAQRLLFGKSASQEQQPELAHEQSM